LPKVSSQQENNLTPLALNIEVVALALYFIRDAFGGAMRYYTSIYNVSVLWFTPDAVAVLCVGIFVTRCIMQNRNVVALLVFVQIILSLILGYFFLGTFNALLSSFKMMIPVFAGFCFCDAYLGNHKKLLWVIATTFYISLAGVLVAAHWTFPWVGFKYESFGATREAGRLWWSFAEQRISGFAADNTMAAYFILITFVLTSIRKSVFWCLIFGIPSIYAIRLTTSKTTMVVLAIYICCLLVVRWLPEARRLPVLRAISLSSYLAILVPIALMLFVSGTGLTKTSTFFSLQDRINNSWQLPFVYLQQLMPVGVLTGCGVGCFNYPQQLFSPLASYWVPVDNFYIGTYLMFGLPFVLFMAVVIRASFLITDVYKLSTIFVMNLFTITVLCYGPATGLLMISFGFSEVFSKRASRVMQEGPRLAPAQQPITAE
jgi:hypothetical protein